MTDPTSRFAQFVVTVMVCGAATGFAQSLSEQQKARLESIERLQRQAAGTWANPTYPGIVVLTPAGGKPVEVLKAGAAGTWIERKANGDFVNEGKWLFKDGGSGDLVLASGHRNRALLVGDHLLALQAFTNRGGLAGDGVILFRGTFDFEGRECQISRVTPEQQKCIAGRWTHPNNALIHEVSQEGLWLERKKKGGINTQGTWQIQDDGSYLVELANKWRHRVWPAGPDKLAVVTFQKNGELSGDGALLSRE